MANLQPLSPQGYNITDEPYNTNPFWGDDENPDPTIYTRLTALEEDVDDLETYKADKSQLDDYYTKVEITDIVNNIPIFDSTLYDTKSQVNTKISNANIEVLDTVSANYYNKTETDNKLSTKANITAFNDYYDKTTIDGLLDDMEDAIDDASDVAQQASLDVSSLTGDLSNLSITVGTNTNNIGDLTTRMGTAESDITSLQTGKADKTNTYTKTEVDALIPDMTDYYTKSQVDALIPDVSSFVTSSDLSTALDDYYTKTEIDNTIGDIQTILEAI